jgi:hypothetical protein
MGAQTSCLTVRDGQAYRSHRHLLNEMAGIGLPNPLGAKERRVQSRFSFAYRSGSIYDGLGEAPAMEAGSKWPVDQPRSVRHPVIGLARWRVCNPHLESVMSDKNGASVANSSVRFVHRDTVIRRIRRHQARFGNTFHIARNRAEFDSVGDWHIRDRNGDVAFRNIAIFESYARDAGCLAADELMFGQTLYRMFDDQGRIIGVQESKYRAESVVKAISGTLVEFTVEVPVEQADQSGDAHA